VNKQYRDWHFRFGSGEVSIHKFDEFLYIQGFAEICVATGLLTTLFLIIQGICCLSNDWDMRILFPDFSGYLISVNNGDLDIKQNQINVSSIMKDLKG